MGRWNLYQDSRPWSPNSKLDIPEYEADVQSKNPKWSGSAILQSSRRAEKNHGESETEQLKISPRFELGTSVIQV
jgi:hypothetical protein